MNTRPPPPSGAPPSYAFVTRVYQRSLRPVVLLTSFLGAIWALFSGISFFRNSSFNKSHNVPELFNISIALGALYMAIFVIEAFGLFSALKQQVSLVRIYAFLSVFTSVTVAATGLLRTVIHFTMKNDIITLCTDSADGDTVVESFGFWGPISHHTLSHEEAAEWCNSSWSHNSWSEVLSLLITLFLAGFFTVLAFSYYRQLLDPLSPANAGRAPSDQARTGAFPSHYNPPYNASDANLGYDYGYNARAGGSYTPPPGPPPSHDNQFAPPYDNAKLPGYSGADGKAGYMEGDDKEDPFAVRGERDGAGR